MTDNPTCVRAIPYQVNDNESTTMCLYVHTGGKEITEDFRERAKKMLASYNVEFVNLERRPLSANVIPLPSSEKTKARELSDLAEIIEKNLDIFENRLNVTAVQASYKIANAEETNNLCVTVFVLGKGKIPVGESDFSEVERLNGYPFDIVEGYYMAACSPYRSAAFPLHLGVGIGVKGQNSGTGTLGAFVEDEDKKHYLLSCEHVIHPDVPEVSNIIVQPSIEDYREDVNKCENLIKGKKESLESCRNKQRFCEGDGEECDKWARRIQRHEKVLQNYQEKLDNLNAQHPRQIATYSWGVKENITKNVQRKNDPLVERKFWVDAAIAELFDDEETELKEETEQFSGTVRGFQCNSLITREIVPMLKLEEETETRVEFRKSGRTTQHTEGQLYTHHFNTCRAGFKKETCFGIFTNTHFKTYCQKCCPPVDVEILEVNTVAKKEIKCAKCNKRIEMLEKGELWGRNCFTIQARGKFSDEGDSGALVYDQHGRAWGIIVGGFDVGNSVVSVAISLEVAIEALERKSGKKLQLWCIGPN